MNKYQPAIKQGIIMGAVSILLFLVLYAVDPMFYAKPMGWVTVFVVNFLALPIVFMILGARNTKPNFTPFRFQEAFISAFLTSVLATVVLLCFNFIFITVIDTTWEKELGEEIIRSTETFMEDMGAPQEAIDEAMIKAKGDLENRATGVMGQLKSALGGLGWYLILALIIGAVQKDKKTEEDLLV
ncbi:MAG: putative neutral ceramidase superfamily lipid hydrolase [Bacteroidia bacterium]|jgi:predicted neutral ceramidase superfamily lipid hydrolase